jgi:hypothetical protein
LENVSVLVPKRVIVIFQAALVMAEHVPPKCLPGRYLISMAGCIFDPAQLKINTKRGKKREGKERERKEEKGRGCRGLVHFIFTSLF